MKCWFCETRESEPKAKVLVHFYDPASIRLSWQDGGNRLRTIWRYEECSIPRCSTYQAVHRSVWWITALYWIAGFACATILPLSLLLPIFMKDRSLISGEYGNSVFVACLLAFLVLMILPWFVLNNRHARIGAKRLSRQIEYQAVREMLARGWKIGYYPSEQDTRTLGRGYSEEEMEAMRKTISNYKPRR